MSKTYLFLTLLFIATQGLFAFFEMASVSFNKVRLQYYVSKGIKRGIWLNYLLNRPSRLFGTTLIGVTASLVIGSECARRFYESIHLDPDWAPLTQVPLVVIFGELSPMFAARRSPEQSAMLCVPIMIVLARVLSPITWIFDKISEWVHILMGKSKTAPLFLSRDEVRMAFEEKEGKGDEFNFTVNQIFQLKSQKAFELMTPLKSVQMISSEASYEEVCHLLSVHYSPILPIFHRNRHNVVAIATIGDLLSFEVGKRIVDSARSPWFVSKEASVLSILQQFKRNNQSTAIILEASGQAIGLLTLDQILSKIFGKELQGQRAEDSKRYIERTLLGKMLLEDFNRQFETKLKGKKGMTLSQFLIENCDHFPVKEEVIRIESLEFTVEEVGLRGIGKVVFRSF